MFREKRNSPEIKNENVETKVILEILRHGKKEKDRICKCFDNITPTAQKTGCDFPHTCPQKHYSQKGKICTH